MAKTVAVIDIGSNSIKLLVATAGEPPNTLHSLFTETIETRISAGISHELPSLTKEAITAGTKTVVELLAMAQKFAPEHISIVATSAVRDAMNGQDFHTSVGEACGHSIRILSGTKEAHYIGLGLSCDPAVRGIRSFIQTDLGGGSMELIRFEAGRITQAISLQLGAVRLTEQFVVDREAPLTARAEAALRQHISEIITSSDFDFGSPESPLIATGGAYTVSRAVLAAQAGQTIDSSSPRLSRTALDTLKKDVASRPLHERLNIPHLPAARADIFPVALITLDTLLKHAQRKAFTHSFYNLRYGIAAQLLKIAE